MIALLNDGAILSIAYDNVRYRTQPEAWNMRVVLGVSTVLGVIGTVAAFGLFFLGMNVFHLDHAHVQTLMYLKLSVAGHLTIFLTRTRGPFWSIRPAMILWIAVLGTQALATLIAVYGLFMAPLGWRYAGFVWGYAVAWFLFNDRLKLLTYWILDRMDRSKKAQARPNPRPAPVIRIVRQWRRARRIRRTEMTPSWGLRREPSRDPCASTGLGRSDCRRRIPIRGRRSHPGRIPVPP